MVLIALIGCLAMVIAVNQRLEGAEGDRSAEISVLTYNIRYLNTSDGLDVWSMRRETVAKTVGKFDVVGLQEVLLDQLSYLKSEIPDFEWYGVGRDDGEEQGEMVPIGWRRTTFEAEDHGTFWLSENPKETGSVGWDAALPRIAGWVLLRDKRTAKRLLVVNTHFDHRGVEAREESAKLLARWIAEKPRSGAENGGILPVVMLGDLNSQVGSPPLEQLIGTSETPGPLRNAREVAAKPDPGPNSTWNGFRQLATGRRIDFILVAGPIEVVVCETLDPRTPDNRFASDHLPVSARVRFNGT